MPSAECRRVRRARPLPGAVVVATAERLAVLVCPPGLIASSSRVDSQLGWP